MPHSVSTASMNNSISTAADRAALALLEHFRAASAELTAAQLAYQQLRNEHVAALRPAVDRLAKASDELERARTALLSPVENRSPVDKQQTA